MQYNLVLVLSILVFAYLVYRLSSYFRKTKAVFVKLDPEFLRRIHTENRCSYPSEEFESLWIAFSRNLGCPKGKIIKNCEIGFLMDSYPLPDMFVDDIFMSYEKYANFTLQRNMKFYDFVCSVLSEKHKMSINNTK